MHMADRSENKGSGVNTWLARKVNAKWNGWKCYIKRKTFGFWNVTEQSGRTSLVHAGSATAGSLSTFFFLLIYFSQWLTVTSANAAGEINVISVLKKKKKNRAVSQEQIASGVKHVLLGICIISAAQFCTHFLCGRQIIYHACCTV